MEDNNITAPKPMEQPTPQNQPTQNSDYPVQLHIEYPEESSRGLALLTLIWIGKAILLIPHLIVMYIFSLFVFVALVVAQIFVLFKGRYPRSLFELQRGIMLWQNRMNAYLFGLTDQYPPFEFEAQDKTGAIKALKKLALAVVIIVVLLIVISFLGN